MNLKTRKLAQRARFYRRLHKYIAIPMIIFMFLLGVTGLLLAWKSELQLKPSSQTTVEQTKTLIPLQDIHDTAIHFADSLGISSEINRIDYRPKKGIAKIRFEKHFTEIQIDCYSGKILSRDQRNDSIIEMIHDGSIVDYLVGSSSENAKLIYSSITALSLILLSFSGFWMWLKPKQIKRHKAKKH